MPSPKIGVAATKFVLAGSSARDHNLGMAGYGQFCPVARASEVFAERWTPLILRELLAGRYHFSEILKGLHRISPEKSRTGRGGGDVAESDWERLDVSPD